MITSQAELDYIQAAHYRVAADSQLLEKRAFLTLPAGQTTIALPIELVNLEAVYAPGPAATNQNQVAPVPITEYLKIITGNSGTLGTSQMIFCIVGRTLYLWPSSSTDVSLLVYYSYKPGPIDSSSMLALSGQAERLVERLASAYALLDDGQPELGQAELGAYYKDLGRVKHQNRRSEGMGGQLSLAGRRRPSA